MDPKYFGVENAQKKCVKMLSAAIVRELPAIRDQIREQLQNKKAKRDKYTVRPTGELSKRDTLFSMIEEF